MKTPEQVQSQRFYRESRLATEIQGLLQCSIMQKGDQLLAQQNQQLATAVETELLATDLQRSVLHCIGERPETPIGYSPYGHRPAESGLTSLLGFNGERRDAVTGHYLLGNGYRAFDPVLMRFNSPDSLSPFGKGGINAYSYCLGDPVNRHDKTGGFSALWIKTASREYIMTRSARIEGEPWYKLNTRDIEIVKHVNRSNVPFAKSLHQRDAHPFKPNYYPGRLPSNVQLGKTRPNAGESLQEITLKKMEAGSSTELPISQKPAYSHLENKILNPIYEQGSMLVGDTITHRDVMKDLTQSFAEALDDGAKRTPSNVRLYSIMNIRNP